MVPLNVGGEVLRRPWPLDASSLSLGMLVSTVKRQASFTVRRIRLELRALNVTACSPSPSSPVVNVSLSPSRLVLAVMFLPSRVTRMSLRFERPLMSSTTSVDGFLTYKPGPGVTAATRGTPMTCQAATAANRHTAAMTMKGQRRRRVC